MLRAVLLVFAIALALVLPDRAPAQSWPGLETYYMSDYAGVSVIRRRPGSRTRSRRSIATPAPGSA